MHHTSGIAFEDHGTLNERFVLKSLRRTRDVAMISILLECCVPSYDFLSEHPFLTFRISAQLSGDSRLAAPDANAPSRGTSPRGAALKRPERFALRVNSGAEDQRQ